MLKSERREAIRERARNAIRNLYHNATPDYPRDVPEEYGDYFESWFHGAASFEIEYLNDGGAYGSDYRKTLSAKCNAGRYKSEAARAYYIRWKMRAMRRERSRCNDLDSRTTRLVNAQWERIGEFGKLYTYGRGGRTLAPDNLASSGVYWNLKENYFDDSTIADCVDAIQILESFNAYVTSWCASVPEMWREQFEELKAEENAELAEEIQASRPDMHA